MWNLCSTVCQPKENSARCGMRGLCYPHLQSEETSVRRVRFACTFLNFHLTIDTLGVQLYPFVTGRINPFHP